MRKYFDHNTYLQSTKYEAITFFNFSVYIFGSEKIIKAILFDSYYEKSMVEMMFTSLQKGLTPAIENAIHFFTQYERKIFVQPPQCDFSLFTSKEQKVLRELLRIQPGTTISYSQLASRCGFTGAARFVGNVMAKNLFPVMYPCHRVIRSNGDIGNYSGGPGIKEFLLQFEKT